MSGSGGGYRLAEGGLIDRARKVSFTYNDRPFEGYRGDTLASALIANGVCLVGRSFKYHRPRGFYGAGVEDPHSMLAVRDGYGYEPALRAGQVQLCEGLQAWSVTGYPSPGFDLAAGVQLFAGVLSAGFYYKTFKWPSWALFEPWIERATGFGRPRRDLVERRAVHHRHVSCDVLIVGAGPAGLAAARGLGAAGLNVILADQHPQVGGSLNYEQAMVGGRSGAQWARTVAEVLGSAGNVRVLTSTLVSAAYEGNHFTLVQSCLDRRGVREECHWKVRAQQVVLTTGMIDRPLLFPDNDRPGIMLAGAVRRLMAEFGVSPARRLAIYTNNDSGYLTASAARRAGVAVAAVVDTREERAAIHAGLVREAGVECLFESEVVATSGYRRLESITVRTGAARTRKILCDGLAVTGGITPLIHLASHRGVRPAYDVKQGAFLASTLPVGWHAAGGVRGALDLEAALSEGEGAAQAVGAALGVSVPTGPVEVVEARSFGAGAPLGLVTPLGLGMPLGTREMLGKGGTPWRMNAGASSRVWVDFQNDVKASDVELATRENYVSVEHLKRYTTLGMGTDQGRTSNVNGLALLASLTGREIDAVGTTTFRPPYAAVRMGTIAHRRQGALYKPRRYLPAHAVHVSRSAVFEDFGWERPDWYRCNGLEREAAVAAEMAAVRTHVGVFDGSSLGKIEVTGPDAGEFLSRFYVSSMRTLRPGRIRYSVMLKEDGVIFDDGVVARLAENHFLASPTSGNAESVAAWFERWRQTEWPSMRVAVSSVTSNWASIAIAGPRARELLGRLAPGLDISNAAFPHMSLRECEMGGVEARVARVSFTGELQYEISVPARYGASLMETLLVTDQKLAPWPIGLEAWLRLRLEKGYLHLGSDTNGRTTPLDVGMAGAVAKREDDFIGKRSLSLAFAHSGEREQLVGLVALDGVLQVGGRVLVAGAARPPCATRGYVTSACFSPSLGQSIGLALIEQGFAREGEEVSVFCEGRIVRGRISRPAFYDPVHERLGG